MLKNPAGTRRDTLWAKFTAISCQVSPALLLDVSAGYCQRTLVNVSGMIRAQMGMHNRSEMVKCLGCLERYHPITGTVTSHLKNGVQPASKT
jgi:hypothetical protein